MKGAHRRNFRAHPENARCAGNRAVANIEACGRCSPICAQSSSMKASPSFRNRRRRAFSGDRFCSAILAAKVAAAEESARVKAEQEAAAAAHAAEVAEFNRQKAIADEQRRQERAKDKAEQEARERIAAEARKAEDARIAAERAARWGRRREVRC